MIWSYCLNFFHFINPKVANDNATQTSYKCFTENLTAIIWIN